MPNRTTLNLKADDICPGVSVVSVIFGFHDGELKILLNRFHITNLWMLPDGFVLKDQNVDDEVYRILKLRTGIENVYLRQFYTFGDFERIKLDQHRQILEDNGIKDENHWFLQRFVEIAYLALVEYSKVELRPGRDHEVAQWFSINEIPALFADHNKIIDKALLTLRQQLDYLPVESELLPDKFTLSELRAVYEIIMGRSLDTRNFQRKLLSLDLIRKLDETRKKKGSKDATLYCFNKEKYNEALRNGTTLVNS